MILEIKTKDTYEEVVETLAREICPDDLGIAGSLCHTGGRSLNVCVECWKGALKEVAE